MTEKYKIRRFKEKHPHIIEKLKKDPHVIEKIKKKRENREERIKKQRKVYKEEPRAEEEII